MDIEQIKKEVASGEVVLVDVREPDEWQAGHIPGAQNMPVGSLASLSAGLPKEKLVYLYCRSGGRSSQAEIMMQKLGFPNACNIGGLIEWQDLGGEIIK